MSEPAKSDHAASSNDVPIVSIGMPIFNAGRYLRKAVLSILQQTFSRWELIIVDDASNDGALDSIQDLHDPRIRVVRGSENRGLANRLNETVGLARGAYFARMDQDDVSHPERLARQLAFLESQPGIDVVGARSILIDGDDRIRGVLEYPQNHEEVCRRPWRGILMPHPTWMGRTAWFKRNPYRSPGPYFCEDQELLLRTHRTSRFSVIGEPLLAYRVRGPVPPLKMLRTRATLANLQVRHFLRRGEPRGAMKAAAFLIGKCVHDLAAPFAGRSARSAVAGVPLARVDEQELTRWQDALAQPTSKGADSADVLIAARSAQTDVVDIDTAPESEASYLKPQTFWLLAFVFCCLQALMVQKLVLPLIPSLHGGHGLLINDATVFHEAASTMAYRIKANGWSEWSLYPTGFTGNVGILAALYALAGPEPTLFIPLNAAAHVTGALMLYLMGPLLWPGKAGKLGGLVAATLFVIFPSSLQWYSQNHKDSFTIAGSLMILYGWLRLVSGQPSQRLWFAPLLALGGMVLLIVMRPYLSILLAGALFFSGLCWLIYLIFARARKIINVGRFWSTLAFLGIVFGGALVGSLMPASETATQKDFGQVRSTFLDGESELQKQLAEWVWRPLWRKEQFGAVSPPPDSIGMAQTAREGYYASDTASRLENPGLNGAIKSFLRAVDGSFRRISELRVHFIAYGLSVGAGSGVDQDQIPDNLLSAVLYLPRALFVGAFAPFPSSWLERVSLIRLAGSAETFLWYVFAVGLLFLLWKRPSVALATGIVFCAALIAILSYTQPNVGTLHRARYGYWMFLLLCGSIGWLGVMLPLLKTTSNNEIRRRNSLAREDASGVAQPARGLESLGVSGAAALLITFIGFLGFLGRDLLLIQMGGMNEALDIFFSAAILPMVFVTCLSMPLADVLTKPFLAASSSNNRIFAEDKARAFINLGLLIVFPFVVLLLAFPGLALGLVLGSVDTPAIQSGGVLLQIMAPIALLSVFNIVGNAVLNAWRRSTQAAAAQLVVPAIAIGAILLAEHNAALLAAAIGMICGAALNSIVVIGLCAKGGVKLMPHKSLRALRRNDLSSYGWLALAAAFTALVVPVNYYYAGTVGAGSVSMWAFAGKLVTLFNGLFAFGVTAVILPHLASKFKPQDNSSGREHFFFLLVAGAWVGGSVALAFAIFAEPLVFGVFGGGGQLSDVQITSMATVLRIGALQIPVAIAGAIVLKSVVVSGSSVRPVVASVAGLIVNITINQLLVQSLGLQAIAIGALAAVMVTTVILYSGTRARYGASSWVGVMLLFGWLIWSGFVWAIDQRSLVTLFCALLGLIMLAALQVAVWRLKLYHRSSLRDAVP